VVRQGKRAITRCTSSRAGGGRLGPPFWNKEAYMSFGDTKPQDTATCDCGQALACRISLQAIDEQATWCRS
jgi:hypothetical protein